VWLREWGDERGKGERGKKDGSGHGIGVGIGFGCVILKRMDGELCDTTGFLFLYNKTFAYLLIG